MIEYNSGVVMKLSLHDKLKLKQQLDAIKKYKQIIDVNNNKYKRNRNLQEELPSAAQSKRQKFKNKQCKSNDNYIIKKSHAQENEYNQVSEY